MEVIVNRVTVDYNGKRALDNISFSLGEGVHILLGSNGSGKTTLLKVLAGLIKPTQGVVKINGIIPWSISRKKLARIVGYVWQNPYYGFVEARVIDEIKFILEATGAEGNWFIVEKLVPRELFERDPFTLSGGEARRVSIASVLVADQDVWLLDEPFANLDNKGVNDLIEVIDYGRRRGKTIIIATHHVLYADMVEPDTLLLLDNGRLVLTGDWSSATDDVLMKHRVMPRGVLCGENIQRSK
ncbi:ABC transporter ATP-binding protein [Desulfurococcaceae archaeon MEX13E-LK6-19]|nr:ABC transporter ATP-binding protein [Desulfurococcaceae archaeon MEX13E-LK6-19]